MLLHSLCKLPLSFYSNQRRSYDLAPPLPLHPPLHQITPEDHSVLLLVWLPVVDQESSHTELGFELMRKSVGVIMRQEGGTL